MEAAMRKPRDYDAELKALEDRARELKALKVTGLGELVIATGADALTADELSVTLVKIKENKNAGKRETWTKRGAAFFQRRSRQSSRVADRDNCSAQTQPGGAQSASGGAGAT